MRHSLPGLIVLLAIGLILTGCRKSEEARKLEADVNSSVLQKHDVVMSVMDAMHALAGRIDELQATEDSLHGRLTKGAALPPAAELSEAKARLAAVEDSMMAWMHSFRRYDEEGDHEAVMTQLNGYSAQLDSLQVNMKRAMNAAQTTIAAHEQALASVRTPPQRKK